MGKLSHCQKCGAKFRPFWRHRHECYRCKETICHKCSAKLAYISDKVKLLNFEKKELCNFCETANKQELIAEGLNIVIDVFVRSYAIGLVEGKGGQMSGEDAGFLWDIKHQTNELVILSVDKGLTMGRQQGKQIQYSKQLVETAFGKNVKDISDMVGDRIDQVLFNTPPPKSKKRK